MTLPKPVQDHKSTLFLKFSPQCLPYAELAAYRFSNCTTNLKIGLDPNLLQPQPSLIIPCGTLSDAKTILTGKSTISRFFARHCPSKLYNEKELAEKFKVDNIVDAINFSTPETKNEVIETIKASKINDPINLGDIYVWDFASNYQLHDIAAKYENKSQIFSDIKKQISETLSTAPVMDIFKYEIVKEMHRLTNVETSLIYNSFGVPRESSQGNLCIAIPQLKLKGGVMNAKELVEKFKTSEMIKSTSATGVMMNFTFNNDLFRKMTLRQVILNPNIYGKNSSGLGNLAVVEFSSPNIAKPFHVGHLRSTIIGNFYNNVLKANGWSTVSMNYLGDWGKQYGLLAVGFERYGNEEELVKDPIKHLYEVYVKINTEASEDESVHDVARSYFAKMEAGEPKALSLWQRFRDLSIVKYKETYERFNVFFDVYSGESMYSLKMMREVLEELETKKILIPVIILINAGRRRSYC